MIRLMTEHPSAVGENYLEHLVFATRFGASMIVGGLVCCVHGVLPFLCTLTGSRIVLALHGTHPLPRAQRSSLHFSGSWSDVDRGS